MYFLKYVFWIIFNPKKAMLRTVALKVAYFHSQYFYMPCVILCL